MTLNGSVTPRSRAYTVRFAALVALAFLMIFFVMSLIGAGTAGAGIWTPVSALALVLAAGLACVAAAAHARIWMTTRPAPVSKTEDLRPDTSPVEAEPQEQPVPAPRTKWLRIPGQNRRGRLPAAPAGAERSEVHEPGLEDIFKGV